MRAMCLSGINTLSAPRKCKCVGGLLELMNAICTPATQAAREQRLKWQKKEYAKDALFESLFPDMKQFNEDAENDSGWTEVWLFVAVILLLIGVVVLIIYMNRLAPSSSKQQTA